MEQGFTKPTQLPDYIGSVDYLSLMDELYMDAGNPNPLYGEEMINNYRNNVDPELYPNVNWLDAVSKDMASNTRGDLTITGGSDILRYALVASYYGERGIFVRDESKDWDSSTRLNKYNIRSNVDINVTKTTVVGISIGGYLQEQNGMAVSGQDVWNHAFETPPFVHPIQYSEGRDVRVRERTNPWAEATQHGYQTTSSSKVESLFSVEQDLKFITPGLKFKGLFSFDRYSKSWVKRHRTPTYYNPATGRDEEGNLLLSVGTDGQEFLDTENKGEWGNKATYLKEISRTIVRLMGNMPSTPCFFITNATIRTAMSSLSAAWVSPDVLPIRMTIATLPNLTLDITAPKTSRKGTALVSSLCGCRLYALRGKIHGEIQRYFF